MSMSAGNARFFPKMANVDSRKGTPKAPCIKVGFVVYFYEMLKKLFLSFWRFNQIFGIFVNISSPVWFFAIDT